MPTFSSSVEAAIHTAFAYANARRHEFATLEHMLLALVDDRDAARVMKACDVSLARLRQTLIHYLDGELSDLVSGAEGTEASPTRAFTRVIERAMTHVDNSNRDEVTGADLLIAIFSERECHATYFLQQQDMTRYDAVNFVSHGIAKKPGFRDVSPIAGAGDVEEIPASSTEGRRTSRTGNRRNREILRQHESAGPGRKSRPSDRAEPRNRTLRPDPVPQTKEQPDPGRGLGCR